MIKQALIAVADKAGIVEFARALAAMEVAILSTGGTAKRLTEAGLAVTEVAAYTGFPEMLDARVKTLHPKVHGGLLARRDTPAHTEALKAHQIVAIDLLVVNLYPFARTVANGDCTLAQAIENIDIGGPAMLRSAAKNYRDVTVVVDQADYETVLDEMRKNDNAVSARTRFWLASKAFAHTAQYDGAITNYLTSLEPLRNACTALEAGPASASAQECAQEHVQKGGAAGMASAGAAPAGAAPNCETALKREPLPPTRNAYPAILNLAFEKVQDLRYGENPHQQAAFYRDCAAPAGALANYRQLQGKALSYNNLADADAAWECVKTFDTPACVIVKHANPCGAAIAETPAHAYAKALQTDPAAAFGGIVAFNREVDGITARDVTQRFVEVLLAPAFSEHAKQHCAEKPNLRLLEIPLDAANSSSNSSNGGSFDLKRIGGGLLVQSSDAKNMQLDALRLVTKRRPTLEEMDALVFAWRVAKFVKSNAIVFGARGMTLGIGAGQMSRIDAVRVACLKAQNAGLSLAGCAAASDAFFPFQDALELIIAAGARCIIQPGGSVRDDEIIAAADARHIAMVLTSVRHFRH